MEKKIMKNENIKKIVIMGDYWFAPLSQKIIISSSNSKSEVDNSNIIILKI